MRSSHLVVLAPLLVLFAYPSVAQVPSGQFSYAFTNTSLWDVSGTYTNTDPNGYDVVIADIQHQANGQIIGERTETYDNGEDYGEGTGSISGRTFDHAGTVGWRGGSVGFLTGVSGGVSYVAKFKTKGTAVIVPSSLTVFSSGSARVCVVGGKCVTATSGVALPLPDGMTGDWTLDTDIAAVGNSLTGTGTITLSNGRVLTYQIKGSYKTKSQIAKLKLIGEGDATRTSLSLTTQGVGMDLTGLKGKVLGQKPRFP